MEAKAECTRDMQTGRQGQRRFVSQGETVTKRGKERDGRKASEEEGKKREGKTQKKERKRKIAFF